MGQYKFTGKLGESDRGEVEVAAGDAEAQSETVSVNIDVTNAGRSEIITVLDRVRHKILTENWPPLA